jgi:3-hydroxymyristoyl/3-hydroxydecanoyl-(acyl carrier protein) dehydratase
LADRWKLLNEVKRITPNTLDARACVPKDSIWFAGHFPGEPILPGIALLHTVYEAILGDARARGESVKVSSLKRVRFTGPVLPGETLLLSLTREDGTEEILFNFKILVKESIVCSGMIAVNNVIDKKVEKEDGNA